MSVKDKLVTGDDKRVLGLPTEPSAAVDHLEQIAFDCAKMTSQVQNDELTEEQLLEDATDIHLDHDFDEDALLGDDPPTDTGAQNIDKLPVEEKTIIQETIVDKEESHHEELDYDDDDDPEEDKETRSKFSSERAKTAITPASGAGTSISSSSVTSNNSARFRDSQNKGRNIQNKNLPSLLGMEVKPPPILPGGKILVNPNFRPQQQPMVRLTLPGAPTITMPPPMPAMPIGPIIPRLPNGTPLIAYPPNHGVAGFGHPPPLPFPPMIAGPPGQWDHRVAAFLTNVAGRSRRRRRSSSYSSCSSSSRSSRSRSRSRSSSRSPRRKRRSSSHRRDRRRSGDRRRDRRGHEDRRYNRDRGSRSSRNGSRADRSKSTKEVAEECAKAVGVDNDYLSKVEDQRKRREELVRKKEQRRFGGSEDNKTEERRKTAEDERKKAYLCVTIKNMTHLPSAPARIEKLAADIGSVTKCWRFNEDQVNLIFKDHSNAKDFLLKYNNKVLSGLRMQVTLEKAYFNLSEIN